MILRKILIIFFVLNLYSCSKNKEVEYDPLKKIDPFTTYNEGLEAFEKNDFFSQIKNFLKQN